MEVLHEHREAQHLERQAAGVHWQDEGLVFTSSIGTPIDRSNMRWFFKALLKDAGLPDIRFHDLRHTAASLMLNNGIPLIVFQGAWDTLNPALLWMFMGISFQGNNKKLHPLWMSF